MASTPQAVRMVNDHIFSPAALVWQPPPHLKDRHQLEAWSKGFITVIAQLNPTEAEAKAAFIAVSQIHDGAHWPPPAAFCKAIQEARADRRIGDTTPKGRDYSEEPLWLRDEKGNRWLNRAAFDRQVRRALAGVVDNWLLQEAEWVESFLATFKQQRVDPPVTAANFAALCNLPATDRDYARGHLVQILKEKAWRRAQQDVLGLPIGPLEITEADARIIRERVESQPYERSGRARGGGIAEAIAALKAASPPTDETAL